jgi:hypothetical protein
MMARRAPPISPLLVPTAHDVAAIGAIDDFYDDDFSNVSALSASESKGEPAGSGRKRVCETPPRWCTCRLPAGMVIQDFIIGAEGLSNSQALDAKTLTSSRTPDLE